MAKKAKAKTNKEDRHGAAKSGKYARDVIVPHLQTLEPQIINEVAGCFNQLRIEFIEPKVQFIYGTIAGQDHFKADGYSPMWNAWIEVKHGKQAEGTAQEKIFFDLDKYRDGVYTQQGRRLIYILSGDMETDKRGRLFKYKIEEARKNGDPLFSHDRICVLHYSEITRDSWYNLFTDTTRTSLQTLALF